MSTLRVGSVRNPAGTGFSSLSVQSMVRVNTANGYGSTNTVIRRFSTIVVNQGSDITYADSATLGASFTINTDGVYAINYTDFFSATGDLGISLNSTQLTTAIGSITAADRLADATTSAANARANAPITLYLPAGSVIRPHTGGAGGGGANSQFTITRVS